MNKFRYVYNLNIDESIRIRKNRILNSSEIHKKIENFYKIFFSLEKKWNELCLEFPENYAILIEEGFRSCYLRYKNRIILSDIVTAKRIYKLEIEKNDEILFRVLNLQNELEYIINLINFFKGVFFISISDKLEDAYEASKKRRGRGRIFVNHTYYDIFTKKDPGEGYAWEIDWRDPIAFEIKL